MMQAISKDVHASYQSSFEDGLNNTLPAIITMHISQRTIWSCARCGQQFACDKIVPTFSEPFMSPGAREEPPSGIFHLWNSAFTFYENHLKPFQGQQANLTIGICRRTDLILMLVHLLAFVSSSASQAYSVPTLFHQNDVVAQHFSHANVRPCNQRDVPR